MQMIYIQRKISISISISISKRKSTSNIYIIPFENKCIETINITRLLWDPKIVKSLPALSVKCSVEFVKFSVKSNYL